MREKGQFDVSINKLYLLMSSVTGHPYIDTNRIAYGFFVKEEAELFVQEFRRQKTTQKFERINVDIPRYYVLTDLLATCYAAGASTLRLSKNKDTQDCAIIPNRLPLRYYNNELNWIIAMLKTTRKESWLNYLVNCHFIIPAKVAENKLDILYGTTKIPNSDDFYYLLFSDLTEYSLWASKVHGWSPLQVDYDTLYKICHQTGYVFNVTGNRFVVFDKIAKKLPKSKTSSSE